MPDLGVNALAMFTRDRARLLRLRAGVFVVMDAPEQAQALIEHYTGITAIYRALQARRKAA